MYNLDLSTYREHTPTLVHCTRRNTNRFIMLPDVGTVGRYLRIATSDVTLRNLTASYHNRRENHHHPADVTKWSFRLPLFSTSIEYRHVHRLLIIRDILRVRFQWSAALWMSVSIIPTNIHGGALILRRAYDSPRNISTKSHALWRQWSPGTPVWHWMI